MEKSIAEVLESRREFINHLEKDIQRNIKTIEAHRKEKENLEELTKNIRSLSVYPEKEALIPLSKNIFMKGRVVHTGEYYVKKKCHPEPLVVLQSVQQTLDSLGTKVKLKETDVNKAEYATHQLEERLRLLKGDDQDLDEEATKITALPEEIKSDRGVAIKVGNFYEILEFEE
nr:unnamed protein product [Callosobruchus chinensis]